MEKMSLPAYPYLTGNDEDRDAPAIKGTLRCSCGCETFRIYHSGQQAHPLLASWYCGWIRASRETLLIEARCSACGQTVPLHCDDRSADGWRIPEQIEMAEFIHPKLHDQRLHIEVAYNWDEGAVSGHCHAGYIDFMLDAWNDGYPKKIRIFE